LHIEDDNFNKLINEHITQMKADEK